MAYVRSARDAARLAANAQALAQAGIAPDAARGFQGSLIAPGDPMYDTDRQVADVAVQKFPKLIAYCTGESDVRIMLGVARLSGIPLVCRAGGHSTAGYSVNDGIVLDVSRLNQVRVDGPGKTALVQAGTSFGIVNATLNAYQFHVPGGGCEGVCVGGYMQGGGYGFTSREYGMHIDNVLGFRMMLADGSVVAASATENMDLFWAVRGGTGNNFGVLLDVTYQLHDLYLAWGFGLQWAIDDAPAALLEMQTNYMLTGASPKLGYMTVITSNPQGQMVLLMRGIYDGSAAEGKAAIASLLQTPGASLPIDMVDSYANLNTALLETPYPLPPLPAGVKEDKQAGYIGSMLTLADWQKIIAYYKTTPVPYNTAVIEPYGGAINLVSPHACAFVHRAAQMDFFVDVFWIKEADKPAALAWLDGFMSLMQPYFTGMVYQNYPRATFTDYPLRYWGLDTYAELIKIKQKYDPTGFFTFPQAIGVWQGDTDGRGVGHAALTAAIAKAEITREV
jgi:hypothetical protein